MGNKPYYSGKEIYLFDELYLKRMIETEFDECLKGQFDNNFKILRDFLPFSNGVLAFNSPINKKDVIAFVFQEDEKLNITGYMNNWPILRLVFQDMGAAKLEDVLEVAGNDNTTSNNAEIKKLFMKLFINLVLELPALEMRSIASGRNKKFREKRKELFTLYENKEHGYTLKRLPPIDGYYDITEMVSGFKVVPSGYNRRIMSVPSAIYPMPNSKTEPRLFTPENTEDFTDDSISDILSSIEFLPGRCYTNANKIITSLGEEYKFYSGWVFVFGQAVHHAWVVKGNSILDVANTRKDNTLNPETHLSKQEYAKLFAEYYKEALPFKEKYPFGKVALNKFYIGVESNYKEAIDSFNTLMDDYPNHPDYLNVNKETGGNETLKYMYQELKNNK